MHTTRVLAMSGHRSYSQPQTSDAYSSYGPAAPLAQPTTTPWSFAPPPQLPTAAAPTDTRREATRTRRVRKAKKRREEMKEEREAKEAKESQTRDEEVSELVMEGLEYLPLIGKHTIWVPPHGGLRRAGLLYWYCLRHDLDPAPGLEEVKASIKALTKAHMSDRDEHGNPTVLAIALKGTPIPGRKHDRFTLQNAIKFFGVGVDPGDLAMAYKQTYEVMRENPKFSPTVFTKIGSWDFDPAASVRAVNAAIMAEKEGEAGQPRLSPQASRALSPAHAPLSAPLQGSTSTATAPSQNPHLQPIWHLPLGHDITATPNAPWQWRGPSFFPEGLMYPQHTPTPINQHQQTFSPVYQPQVFQHTHTPTSAWTTSTHGHTSDNRAGQAAALPYPYYFQ